jgi:hypothetical protein
MKCSTPNNNNNNNKKVEKERLAQSQSQLSPISNGDTSYTPTLSTSETKSPTKTLLHETLIWTSPVVCTGSWNPNLNLTSGVTWVYIVLGMMSTCTEEHTSQQMWPQAIQGIITY